MRFPKIEARDNVTHPSVLTGGSVAQTPTTFWWVWKASNGKVRATSETYSSKRHANRGAEAAHDEFGGHEFCDLSLLP